jgi:hypothetical protein
LIRSAISARDRWRWVRQFRSWMFGMAPVT